MGYKRKKHPGVPFLNVRIPQWIAPVEAIVAPHKLSPARMRVILHNFYLCMVMAMQKRDGKMSVLAKQGYFPVYWGLLKELATNEYPSYINVIEHAGIIERHRNAAGGKNYLPGVHSQLYRFIKPKGMERPLFRIEKLEDYRCIKSVLRTRDRYALGDYNDAKCREMNGIHIKLREFVRRAKIDTSAAAAIMKSFGNNPDTDDYAKIDLDYLEGLNDGTITWFKVDGYGERCHHPFTNLSSKYRKAIRFDSEDQALVNIDIKNSQPYFSAAIAAGTLIDQLLPEFGSLKPLVAELKGKPDYTLYSDLCTSGGIYEYIGQKMGKSRNEIKQQFFRAVLFSKLRVYGEDRLLTEVFKQEFPSVHKFFAAIKRCNERDFPELVDIIKQKRGKWGNSNNAYKILSCAMQRLEARLVTQHIADKLIKAGIGPFITIHDSYIVLPRHQEKIVKLIEETFKDFQMQPPDLKIEVLE